MVQLQPTLKLRVHLCSADTDVYGHTDTDTFSLCPFDTATRLVVGLSDIRQPGRNSAGSILNSPHAAPDGLPCPYPHKWTQALCFQHVLNIPNRMAYPYPYPYPHKWTRSLTNNVTYSLYSRPSTSTVVLLLLVLVVLVVVLVRL